MGKYKKIQFIALVRDTAEPHTAPDCSDYPNKFTLKRLPKDQKNRLKHLILIVEKANGSKLLSKENDVLKIIVGPEFMFRPKVEDSELYDSYPHAELINIMDIMRKLFSEDIYKN